jgi:PAS domain S-box-containing protein
MVDHQLVHLRYADRAVLVSSGLVVLSLITGSLLLGEWSGSWLPGIVTALLLLSLASLWVTIGLRRRLMDTEQQQQKAERSCHLAETSYRALTERAPMIIYQAALDEYASTLYISPQVKVLGFSAEEWLGDPQLFWRQIHPDDRSKVEEQIRAARAEGRATGIEYRIYTRAGQLLWMRDDVNLICDSAGQPLYLQGVMMDITPHKETTAALRDSIARIRLIADNLPALIAYVDHQQIYQFVNKGFEAWYRTTNIIGCHLREVAGDQSYVGIQDYVEAALSGVPIRFEYSRVYPDGVPRHVEISYIPHFGPDERVLGFFTLVQDLTERKRAEQQVRASLDEKEVLLKEIHHRVKNNLQVISSLLYLQSERVVDPHMRIVLQDCQNRVKSMALIHEKLYLTHDLARIDAAEYIQNLAGHLVRSYAAQTGGVQLRVHADNIFLGIDTATACGLILNELVSNALKHAFPNGHTGEIYVGLTVAPDHKLTLAIGDNGIGLPGNFDFRASRSLGLQLVNTLVNQLNGVIELHQHCGVLFKIQFAEVS